METIFHNGKFEGSATLIVDTNNRTERFTFNRGFGHGFLLFGDVTDLNFTLQVQMGPDLAFQDWPSEDALLGNGYAAGSTITATDGKRIDFQAAGVYAVQITWVSGTGAVYCGASTTNYVSRLGTMGVTDQVRTGITKTFTVTTDDTPDYSALDVVGGIQTITLVNSVSGRPIKLTSLVARDKTGLAPALTFMFFKATPASGTYTDNGALVFGSGDLANFVGAVKIVAGDWYIPVSGSGVAAKGDIGQIMAVDATSLFCLIIADSTWNAATTSDLIVDLGIEQL